MTASSPHLKALFIAERSQLGAVMADEWLAQGNSIAVIWTADRRRLRPNLLEKVQAVFAGIPTLWSVARRHGIELRPIPHLSRMPDLEAEVRATGADVLITVATGTIVPASMLALFPGRTINCHPAMLPHYRGPQPRLAMLVDGCGDIHGGLTLHALSPGIDEGAIVAQRALPLGPDRLPEWDAEILLLLRAMMRNELAAHFRGEREAVPQQPGTGGYRKVGPREFAITHDKTSTACLRLGEVMPEDLLSWVAEPGDGTRRPFYRIMGRLRRTGPATGAKARIGWMTIEADVADGRLVMRRRHKPMQILAAISDGWRMRRVLRRG